MFFSKTMQDVVKGVRANKRDPKPYISAVIAECKKELREADPFVKVSDLDSLPWRRRSVTSRTHAPPSLAHHCDQAAAIRKLTYLLMMGYDMSWADFHVVEVMSQARFAHKRVG